MDLSLSQSDLAFRDEVRTWIAEAYDEGLRAKMAQSKNGYLDREGQVTWQKSFMRADRDGDHYLLNGSKIWTTHAQWADWMFCLVRTSREDKPQKGISFLLLDMKTPGITVRALPTLDIPAEGQQEINQVFFENVRVPVKNRVGEEGKGWTYAKYLLEFERANAYAPGLRRSLKKVRNTRNAKA
jgi:hypothetical protein